MDLDLSPYRDHNVRTVSGVSETIVFWQSQGMAPCEVMMSIGINDRGLDWGDVYLELERMQE